MWAIFSLAISSDHVPQPLINPIYNTVYLLKLSVILTVNDWSTISYEHTKQHKQYNNVNEACYQIIIHTIYRILEVKAY